MMSASDKGNDRHWIGRYGVIFLVLTAIAWGIYRFGERIGLLTLQSKLYAFIGLCFIFLCMSYGLILIRNILQERNDDDASVKNNKIQQVNRNSASSVAISELKLALGHQFGRFWRKKVTIIMLTGRKLDVEQLAPGISSQFWLEHQGTVLLWGGDTDQPLDNDWFSKIKALCHQPIDALIWVTSSLSRSPALDYASSDYTLSSQEIDTLSRRITSRYELLGWRLPIIVWSLYPAGDCSGRITQSVGCLLPFRATSEAIEAQLQTLAAKLTEQGIQQICIDPQYTFLLALKSELSLSARRISQSLTELLNTHRPLPVAGIMFSPSAMESAREVKHHWGKDTCWDSLLASLSILPVGLRPVKHRLGWPQVLCIISSAFMVLWAAGIIISFIYNRNIIATTQDQITRASQSVGIEQRLSALTELQAGIERLQNRSAHGVPWYDFTGLNQNDALLHALWERYSKVALPLLRDAAAIHLKAKLKTIAALPPDSPLREQLARPAYTQLKLLLMLARPERMIEEWFSHALIRDWAQLEGVTDSYWQGEGASLLAFYSKSLRTHPQWALKIDDELVSQVRALLVRQMGVTNSETRQYQRMLSQVARQYADMRLADMTGDTDTARLFTTDQVVPGMFTRQAWEDGVKPAIEKVARERKEEMDWVLGDNPQADQAASPEGLQARLTSRYFSDYSAAWLNFLNSLRLQPAPTLSDAIDQLTLMADVRQSPLVALMNTLNVQGRTGQSGDAIADSLVKSAQNLLSREKLPAIDQNSGPSGPLDATFGPLLALTDSQGSSNMSLRTFLTRVTQVRLRLQQVTNAADPQAMTQALAQTVFQGKTVDLTDTRDYGSLVAAGLGQEWSGFGQTVFVRPMEQAWQQVLMPATESLNAQWQQAVVNEWNSAFGGRYPFKNVSSEVSLPLLAKYLNADNGRITRFLQSRLSGVLHREGTRWVPDNINAQGLTFNPAFLQALNQLSRISDVVFTNGEAGLHFELRPGTAADVMQTDLIIDSQKLTYMNQQPVWKRFTWPADTEAPGASLSWISTKAGTRQYGDMPGSWGWIRLLDKAQVSANPGISSSWQLTWQAPDGRPLNYILRTEAGEGPLALLKLRNFTLPSDIFIISDTPDVPDETFVSEED